jgi:hypothetical protein
MKRSRLFMACGTLLLTSVAIFATKANKKFSSVTSARIGSSGPNYLRDASSSLLTLGGKSGQVSINVYTSTGNLDNNNGTLSAALFTATHGSVDVQWH